MPDNVFLQTLTTIPVSLLFRASNEYYQHFNLPRLFSDADKSNRDFLEVALQDNIDPRVFYREVILSYRLLFGQDSNSHNDFNAWIKKGNPLPEEYPDSFLPLLCGQSWDSAEALPIYEFIEADDPSTHYSPTEDFPFLGKRLLDIQKHVLNQKPNGFWAMWYDKRDPAQWWTSWVSFRGPLKYQWRMLKSID